MLPQVCLKLEKQSCGSVFNVKLKKSEGFFFSFFKHFWLFKAEYYQQIKLFSKTFSETFLSQKSHSVISSRSLIKWSAERGALVPERRAASVAEIAGSAPEQSKVH